MKKYLIGALLFLSGLVAYLFNKKQTAEGLNKNQKTKETLNELTQVVLKNEASLELEKNKRSELEKDRERAKTVTGSLEQINDFLNKK